MDILYSLSNMQLITVVCTSLIALFLLATFAFRKILPFRFSKEDINFVIQTQTTLFSVCSLILAFSLVQVEGNLRKVAAQISQEATQINDFDRLLLASNAFNLPMTDARKLLINYVESITTSEWQAISDGKETDLVNPNFAELSKLLMSKHTQSDKNSAAYSEILKQLGSLADARDTRIELAGLALPKIFWGTILVALVITVTVSALLAISKIKTFIMGFQVFVLGLLLSVVYINDKPFKGETSVNPNAIKKTISIMHTRY